MSEQNESTQEKKGGWKQWTKAEAREVLAAWKKSGLPLGTFARERGVGAERLRWWSKRLSEVTTVKRKGKKKAAAVRLVPAMIDGPLADLGPEAAVSIRFPVTGPVVEIANVRRVPSAWVSELLAPMVAAVWSR
jgi:hypothetical protein